MVPRNTFIYKTTHTASFPRTFESSKSPPWVRQFPKRPLLPDNKGRILFFDNAASSSKFPVTHTGKEIGIYRINRLVLSAFSP
jgi:hypothetical protein